jgi:hypothetical protein
MAHKQPHGNKALQIVRIPIGINELQDFSAIVVLLNIINTLPSVRVWESKWGAKKGKNLSQCQKSGQSMKENFHSSMKWEWYGSVPPLWPIYIGERRTTFAKACEIEKRCYWEHVRENNQNMRGNQWELDKNTLGTRGNVKKPSQGRASHWLHENPLRKTVCHQFGLNARGRILWIYYILTHYIYIYVNHFYTAYKSHVSVNDLQFHAQFFLHLHSYHEYIFYIYKWVM